MFAALICTFRVIILRPIELIVSVKLPIPSTFCNILPLSSVTDIAIGLSNFPFLNTRIVANDSLSRVIESSNSPIMVFVCAFIIVAIHINANVSNVFFILLFLYFIFAQR